MDDDKIVKMIQLGVERYFDEKEDRQRIAREKEELEKKERENAERKRRTRLDIITIASVISLTAYAIYKFELLGIVKYLARW